MGNELPYLLDLGSEVIHNGALNCADDQTRFSGYPGGDFVRNCLRWSRDDNDQDGDDQDED